MIYLNIISLLLSYNKSYKSSQFLTCLYNSFTWGLDSFEINVAVPLAAVVATKVPLVGVEDEDPEVDAGVEGRNDEAMDDNDPGGNPRLARMAPTWDGSFKASLRSKIHFFYQIN